MPGSDDRLENEKGLGAPGFLVVGIGAPSGGIAALEKLFRTLPPSPGMGFVIIAHLDPQRESRLHEVVARHTALPVQVAQDGVLVLPDTVHVLPADATALIENGRLRIRAGQQEPGRKPIDLFFGSLATDRGAGAVGIVLSGGDEDGALGVQSIRQAGGFTMAQTRDDHGPALCGRPYSVIATGSVDAALPVEEMGSHLVMLAAHLANGRDMLRELPTTPDGHAICRLLREHTGHDFSGHEIETLGRRVQRRMRIARLASVDSYLVRLRRDPQEVSALVRDLLINVTGFFRDPAALGELARQVVPRLFEGHGADGTVRLWVPGCGTGEEAYSLAILLREHMDTLPVAPRVQILATDMDEQALATARTARYPEALLDGVSLERRKRFFVREGASLVVDGPIREMCVFSPHSLIRDPPFPPIDLVSCRTLPIHPGPDTQNEMLATFHSALRPGGYLFLGASDNIGRSGNLFEAINKNNRIFRSRSGSPDPVRMPLSADVPRGPGPAGEGCGPGAGIGIGIGLRHAVERQVLERFAPAHVVVNRGGDVVHRSACAGRYLEAPAGQPSRRLLSMVRKGLRRPVHTAFRDAVETGAQVQRRNVALETDDGRTRDVTITVEPLHDRGGDGDDPLFVVLFRDEGSPATREQAVLRTATPQDGIAVQLEREVCDTRERLQSMAAEYETAIEELKSSNEELVSVNEEVQSSNEELHAINAELGSKVDALDQANSDLENLFESTDLAILVLDDRLVIRSFTPAVARIFNILPGDRGRPITDLTTRLVLPDFAPRLDEVLRDGGTLESRVGHRDAPHYLMRLSACRGTDNRITGVVVTFADVSSLARSELRQAVLIGELQHRTRNLLAMVQAIAMQTLQRDGPLDTYLQRLGALGRVQGLISRSGDNEIDLGELVRQELHAHAAAEARIRIEGPAVTLRVEQVQTMALALHELSTNAVKYGALGRPDGWLEINWSLESGAAGASTLLLVWSESGVPIPDGPPRRQGYGRQLIEHALAYALRARSEMEFRANGLLCRISLPLGPGA